MRRRRATGTSLSLNIFVFTLHCICDGDCDMRPRRLFVYMSWKLLQLDFRAVFQHSIICGCCGLLIASFLRSGKIVKMADDEDETLNQLKIRLIELMQEHSYIYDKSHEDFKDKNKKINAWARFAEELGVTGNFSIF